MAKRIQFADLKELISLKDNSAVLIETVWSKVEYHRSFQLQKDNLLFTVRSRTDILPGYLVDWKGFDYTVQNIAQVSKDFTVIECGLPSTLKA